MIREIVRRPISGWPVLALLVPIELALLALVPIGATGRNPALVATGVLGFLLGAFLLAGLFMVNPNEARVLQLFGDYKGSAREPGLRWANPLYAKRPLSLRVVSFESGKLKVNDLDGNPVEIAAIVVWRVIDSAEAVFEVDDYKNFV
ncbi:MAG TPA: SPFH domain-containing protein, partial [Anaeromyxobacteraceae bacterium]